MMAAEAEAKAQTELKNFKDIFSLEGKVVVVTGGSRGLGLHAASGLVPGQTEFILPDAYN